MPLDRRLSTLEFTVLGILWKTGGATAYAVTQEFSQSETSAYRSGAGSIYPLLNRLDKAGLVESAGKGEDFTLTPEGLETLQSWYQAPLPDEGFTCLLDPMRSRIYFLRSVPPDQRDTFIKEALDGMKLLAAKCERLLESFKAHGDEFSILATEGTLSETKARIKWLKKIKAEMPDDSA